MNGDVKELKAFVDAERERIFARHRFSRDGNHVSGREIMGDLTRLADTLILRILHAARDDGQMDNGTTLTVVALGGYGRQELNPHSDIDILILYRPSGCPKSQLEPVSSRLIAMLWDVGYEVGHSVRTLRECRYAAAADMDSRTAMLEGRYVGGHTDLYRRFEREIKTRAMRRGVRRFIQEKIDEWRKAMGDPTATVYVQEPDLKDGVGGLREVHIARWVGRSRFGIWEMQELSRHRILPENAVADYEASLEFLWRVRNELHYLSGRRSDRLTFDVQEKVASGLGYEDEDRHLSEEQLMRDYFRSAHWIHECARIIIMQSRWEASWWRQLIDRMIAKYVEPQIFVLRGRLRLAPRALEAAIADGAPERLLMSLFRKRAEMRLPLSVMTRRQVVEALPSIRGRLESSEEARAMFVGLLECDEFAGHTLRDMFHLGVLGAFVPEFEPLRALVQYDLFHKYTADEHTFLAIENVDVSSMAAAHSGQTLVDVYDALDVEDRVTLRLALLLHDIGKGGARVAGHVERSAKLSVEVLKRIEQLSDQQREDVMFLVEQHLVMSHTAQRRDLDDPAVIERFAAAVGSVRRASLLYLLTYADIRAVNADLWTDWTAALLQQLYLSTRRVYRGEFRRRPEELEETLAKVIADLGPDWETDVREHVEMMGRERIAFYTAEELVSQVQAVRAINLERPAVLRLFAQSENYSSAVFCAPNRLGLFARIAGALAASDVNILGADLNTRRDEIAVDTLHVADATTGGAISDERAARVEQLFNSVVAGTTTVQELLARRRPHKPAPTPHRTVWMAPSVRINNDDSRDYTIVDVRTRDRLGLLHTISRSLADLGLDISLAKISTEAYRAVDVFYVSYADREKIRDPARLDEIVETLKQALAD